MESDTAKTTQTLMEKDLIKLLLVEDDAVDRRLVERLLTNCSQPVEFVIELAATLSEAVEYLGSREFDIVLLDLKLPDSSGIETVQKINEVNPRTPIVALTGLDDERTGLGLAIAKKLVEMHGGKIDVVSEVNRAQLLLSLYH